mmetsp:Transcript_20912/g.25707  ORF Transcript_20912/g.25707 Transcript_20912/m.25707 type:complete len:100 (+) Transcript_20912:190-489(+)
MGLKTGYFDSIRNVYAREGAIGFYRGCVPPFFGSVIFRSTQFSVFEAVYTRLQSESGDGVCSEIPGMGGVEYRTILAGLAGGSARSFIECPFEYAKVKR